jgi:hypothetical protein
MLLWPNWVARPEKTGHVSYLLPRWHGSCFVSNKRKFYANIIAVDVKVGGMSGDVEWKYGRDEF